jgi:c-di-GMP-binding flagellar brake protein YcgR
MSLSTRLSGRIEMKTERRDTQRIPIALDTILQYQDKNYRRSNTRDISLDGAFIETSSDRFNKKQRVQVAIRLPNGSESRFHRFEAQVVRVTDKGAGVTFDKIDSDSYAALLDLVFSRQGRGLW